MNIMLYESLIEILEMQKEAEREKGRKINLIPDRLKLSENVFIESFLDMANSHKDNVYPCKKFNKECIVSYCRFKQKIPMHSQEQDYEDYNNIILN